MCCEALLRSKGKQSDRASLLQDVQQPSALGYKERLAPADNDDTVMGFAPQ